MFAVIYRGFIFPEKEEVYKKSWRCVADYFISHCGALGSVLHKGSNNEYIAYSRWPNRRTRDAVWGDNAKPLSEFIAKTIDELKSCIDTTKPYVEIELDVVDDLLLAKKMD